MTEKQKLLVENNHNLIYSFLRKYNLPVDEWYGIVAIGMCKAAIHYDEKRFDYFSTFAYKCMLNCVLQEKRTENRLSRIPANYIYSYDAEFSNVEGGENFLSFLESSNVNVEEEVLSAMSLEDLQLYLSDTEKKVFRLLSLGIKQEDVAKDLGISQAHVSRIKKKIGDKYSKKILMYA